MCDRQGGDPVGGGEAAAARHDFSRGAEPSSLRPDNKPITVPLRRYHRKPKWNMPMFQHRQIKNESGAKYKVRERAGRSNTPPLLFVHGFGCSQKVWEPVLRELGETRPTILFDLPGHGEAAPEAFEPASHATLDGFADDVLAVAEAFAPSEGLVVVAHSVGCNLAWRAAIRRPEMFRTLLLLGPSPRFLRDEGYDSGFGPEDIEEVLRLLETNPAAFARSLSLLVAGSEGGAASWLEGSFCSVDPVCASLFARATFLCDDREMLSLVPTPCVVMQHGEDALVPRHVGELLVRRLPKAELVVLAAKGHAAHLTAPALVADAIRSASGVA